MSCNQGKAIPDNNTKLRLFADSAGYCQHPECRQALFMDVDKGTIQFAEIAHIIAASPKGPRGDGNSAVALAAYENLILLCPTCHTIIDKAPDEFLPSMLTAWKWDHVQRIAETFGVVEYPDRALASLAIEPLLDENRAIFELYGPDNEYRLNPESEYADVWKRKLLSKILPNNRRLLLILDANRSLLLDEERGLVESFRQHVDDLEARHLAKPRSIQGRRFPEGMNKVLKGG